MCFSSNKVNYVKTNCYFVNDLANKNTDSSSVILYGILCIILIHNVIIQGNNNHNNNVIILVNFVIMIEFYYGLPVDQIIYEHMYFMVVVCFE